VKPIIAVLVLGGAALYGIGFASAHMMALLGG